jgi:hypothetical protein
LYYGPTLVQSIGVSGDTVSLLVSGGIGVAQFFAVVPAVLYIDRLGKPWFHDMRLKIDFISMLTWSLREKAVAPRR